MRFPLLDIAIAGFVRQAKENDLKAQVIAAQKEAAQAAAKAHKLAEEYAANRGGSRQGSNKEK